MRGARFRGEREENMRLNNIGAEQLLPASARAFMVAAALAALLSATGVAQAGKADNSLIVGAPIDFSEPDPAAGSLGTDLQFLYNMHDRLVGFDPETLEPSPMLATDWSWSDDQLTLTLTLREGVKFHDGTDFDAEAVKASLEYYKELGRNLDLNDVTRIEVIDDYTIALTTERPNASLVGNLAERPGMIISPRSIADNAPGELGFKTAGTGPFKIARHEPGAAIHFERFEDYWDQSQPWVDRIEVRVIRNSTSAVSAMLSGQLDYMASVDPINIPALERNPRIRVETEPMLLFGLININTGMVPVDDPRVRQAMLMSIDRDAMALSVYGPSVQTGPAMLPTPPGYWTSTTELEGSFPYDPEKAKELLAEAGHPDGVEISLCINANFGMPAPHLKITDIMREQMRPAGITLNVTEAASNAVCSQMLSQDRSVNAFLASWSGRIDPVITYQLMMGSQSFFNTSQVKYDNADELIQELQGTFDRDEQKLIFDKLNQLWVDHLPMIPLYRFSNVVAYNAELKGEQPNLLGRPYVRVLHY